MISILAQERLLGAGLGAVFAGVYVFDQRRNIYKSISESQSQLFPQYQLKKPKPVYEKKSKPVYEKKYGMDLGHMWNKAVDKSLGHVIESLSSRGW